MLRMLRDSHPPSLRWPLPLVATLYLAGACASGDKPGETVEPDEATLQEEVAAGALGPDMVAKAGALVETGHPAEGLAKADEALRKDPHNAELHFVRGLALRALGREREAIEAWRTAIEHNRKLFGAHYGIGAVHLDAGRLDEAKAEFERALDISPSFAGAHYNLGIIALRQGDLDAALVAFGEAAKLDPQDAEPLLEIAAIQEKQGKREDAKSTVRRAAKADPKNGYAQMILGDVLAADEETPIEQVVEAYSAAVEADPSLMKARLALVRALRRAGQPDAALEHSQVLVEAVPDQPIPWSDHAAVLIDLGRHDDAIAAVETALTLDASLVSGHRRKIQALAGAGRCKDANAALQAYASAVSPSRSELAQAKADAKACKK